jgi:branched-chain amino acid transport system permease protein
MPIDLQQALLSGLFLGSIYGLIAVGFAIIFGVMRVSTFAHGELVMLGSYAMVLLYGDAGWGLLLAIPLAGALGGVAGVVIERVALEPIREYPHTLQMIVTIGVGIILQQAAVLLFTDQVRGIDVRFPALDLEIGGAVITGTRVAAGLISLAVNLLVFLLLQRTYWGRAVRAVADDRTSSELVGIPPRRINMIAFGLGSFCAALAGALIITFTFVQPYVGVAFTVKSFIIILLAGTRTAWKALVAGIVLGLVESVAGIYLDLSLVPAVVFGGLVLTLILFQTRRFQSVAA